MDFYVNEHSSVLNQPGCDYPVNCIQRRETDFLVYCEIPLMCNHVRAVEYYIASIANTECFKAIYTESGLMAPITYGLHIMILYKFINYFKSFIYLFFIYTYTGYFNQHEVDGDFYVTTSGNEPYCCQSREDGSLFGNKADQCQI